MRSSTARIFLGLAVLAAAVVLFVVLQGEGDGGEGGGGSAERREAPQRKSRPPAKDEEPRRPSIPTVLVRNGEPVGGVAELDYEAGERIRFRVRSDVSDHVHVHGYDLMKDVEAGGSVAFDFTATLEGVFEAELEDSGVPLLELRVSP